MSCRLACSTSSRCCAAGMAHTPWSLQRVHKQYPCPHTGIMCGVQALCMHSSAHSRQPRPSCGTWACSMHSSCSNRYQPTTHSSLLLSCAVPLPYALLCVRVLAVCGGKCAQCVVAGGMPVGVGAAAAALGRVAHSCRRTRSAWLYCFCTLPACGSAHATAAPPMHAPYAGIPYRRRARSGGNTSS